MLHSSWTCITPPSRMSPVRWYSLHHQHVTRSPSFFLNPHSNRHRFCGINKIFCISKCSPLTLLPLLLPIATPRLPRQSLVLTSIMITIHLRFNSTTTFSVSTSTSFTYVTRLFRLTIKVTTTRAFVFYILMEWYVSVTVLYTFNLCSLYLAHCDWHKNFFDMFAWAVLKNLLPAWSDQTRTTGKFESRSTCLFSSY